LIDTARCAGIVLDRVALALVADQAKEGAALIDRAFRLNANFMDVWLSSGLVRTVSGEWDIAIDHFARAMRLSPFDPMLFMMQIGTANGHFFTGCYEEAIVWAERVFRGDPKKSS
jgi:outer membrane protein assembly factor BamD (BamD/ComL family)